MFDHSNSSHNFIATQYRVYLYLHVARKPYVNIHNALNIALKKLFSKKMSYQ